MRSSWSSGSTARVSMPGEPVQLEGAPQDVEDVLLDEARVGQPLGKSGQRGGSRHGARSFQTSQPFKNGLCASSVAIVVVGPCPGTTTVVGGRAGRPPRAGSLHRRLVASRQVGATDRAGEQDVSGERERCVPPSTRYSVEPSVCPGACRATIRRPPSSSVTSGLRGSAAAPNVSSRPAPGTTTARRRPRPAPAPRATRVVHGVTQHAEGAERVGEPVGVGGVQDHGHVERRRQSRGVPGVVDMAVGGQHGDGRQVVRSRRGRGPRRRRPHRRRGRRTTRRRRRGCCTARRTPGRRP